MILSEREGIQKMNDSVSVHFGTWDKTNSKIDLPFARSQLTDLLRDWFPHILQLSADHSRRSLRKNKTTLGQSMFMTVGLQLIVEYGILASPNSS